MRKHITLWSLFTFFVLSSSRFAADVPLVIWSGESYLSGQNIGISVPLVLNDVESTFQSLFLGGSGLLKNYFSPTLDPEVVVLFLEQELRSEQLSVYSSSFTNLKNLLKTEKSSLYAPFVDLELSLDSAVVSLVDTTVSNSGKVFYVGDSLPSFAQRRAPSSTVTDIDDFKEFILKNSQIFTNSKTDLIIVYLHSGASQDKFKETDLVINSVHTLISSSTTKYVALYTAHSYADPHLQMDFSSSHLKRSLSQTAPNGSSPAPTPFPVPSIVPQPAYNASPAPSSTNQTSNETVPIFRQYFGGWFWELVIVAAVLIPLLLIAVFAIDGIQTPIFESKKKAK